MMDTQTKVRENRARRVASRQGLRLIKARRLDPRASDYGLYALVRANGEAANPARDGFPCSWSLIEVEAFLDRAARRA
jgi:hypothetical protein